jgi:hypothetical protein
MSVKKKIDLLLEMIDVDPNIPLNVANWGDEQPEVEQPDYSYRKEIPHYTRWNSRFLPSEDGAQYDKTLPLYQDEMDYDLENRQSKVWVPPLNSGPVPDEIAWKPGPYEYEADHTSVSANSTSGPSEVYKNSVGSDKDYTNKYPGPSKETVSLASTGAGLGISIMAREMYRNRLKNKGK